MTPRCYPLRVEPHRLAEARSLAYHRRIAERIGSGEVDLAPFRARIEAWRQRRLAGVIYLDRWAALLAAPPAELAAALVRDDEEMRALRQSTPLSGVLSPTERWEIWRRVRREMEAKASGDAAP